MNANDDATSLTALEGNWTLSAIDGFEVPEGDGRALVLSVDREGKVSGFSGVNRFSGSLDPDGPKVFRPLATTRRAGPPEAMALERAFLELLSNADSVAGGEDRLTLSAPDGSSATVVRAESHG